VTDDDVVFLAADTMRSRAYAQALAARGVRLREALLVTSSERARWGQADAAPPAAGGDVPVFAPDLSIPLADSLAALCETTRTLDAGTINDPAVTDWLAASGARFAVYSGFGGELVKAPVLRAGPRLLHMHSGWLPDYRGSTTIYYSFLRERSCGVSALLLDEQIDTGPILRRKRYPAPPAGVDVDYVYDSAIRGDLLADLVEDWARDGSFGDPVEQEPGAGRTYYIIHPVLKHVALNAIHRARR
jgi:methionyl-tRNA formyltransferase